MRKRFVAGNWKMHMKIAEAEALAAAIVERTAGTDSRVLVAPPFTALHAVSKVLKGSHVELGAQNMAAAEKGAHTGEISPLMLADIGVSSVILGHSERRHDYGESDSLINSKVVLALSHGFEVILCVGETLEERDAGNAERVVGTQLESGLAGVSEDLLARVVVAYEPVWAIGTGRTATPEDADAIHAHIRGVIADMYSSAAAESLVIQYGGSVKPDNASGLLGKENIDGALVGGASLKAEDFAAIVNA
ncbi:MAG: triose-phosphate isomerase [Spirochaetaceae bacterium]|nr:MAG: triose-phosphate isomerase [Spirochaetaceae bacterium]